MDQPSLFSDPVQPEPLRREAPEPSADPFRIPDRTGQDHASPSPETAPA